MSCLIRTRRGFTLIELMVVLLITLVIMGMLTSFFITTTKVVSIVELKLRLNEQARGILDTLDEQIVNACANERGGQFVIKGFEFADGDTDPKVSNTVADSKRKIDMLNYVQTGQTGLVCMKNCPPAGGYAFGLYQELQGNNLLPYEDFAMAALLSNIHYAFDTGTHNDPYTDFLVTNTAGETLVNNDVSRLCYSLQRRKMNPAFNAFDNTSGSNYPTNAIPHQLEPGYEMDGPGFGQGLAGAGGVAAETTTWFVQGPSASFENVYIMDLAIAVWDETDRKFHRVPSSHAVYFAPVPKAIMISMTVCDLYKKGRISYSRIIRLPAGTGDGHFDATLANADNGATAKALAIQIMNTHPKEAVDLNSQQLLSTADLSGVISKPNHKLDLAETVLNFHSLPLPLNRLKRLRTAAGVTATDLDPAFVDTTIFK